MMTPKDLYAKTELQLQRQLPFVAYRKPGANIVMLLFQEDNTSYFVNDHSESGFVFARFQDEQQPLLIPAEHVISCKDDRHGSGDFFKTTIQRSDSNKATHLQLVSKGIDAIEKGRFRKVVLSRKEEVTFLNPDAVKVFRKLLKNYPSAFCYLWFHPATGLWTGATPETLLKVEGNRFETMALAGTQKFEGTAKVPWNKKEKEEQQMVTDFIVARLQPLVRKLNVSDTYTARAGNLLHLRTDIKGIIHNSPFNIQRLIKVLHPTPAVCGYPEETAKQFILKNENYDREFYTGFLGELNFPADNPQNTTRQSSVYVNLRCMKILNDKVVLYVGGGINKGAVPESEWEETVSKTQTILNVLINVD